MVQVGGQGAKNLVMPGYWYKYRLDIDMPIIYPEDNARVSLDVNTAYPDNEGRYIQLAGHICHTLIYRHEPSLFKALYLFY